MSIYQKKDMLEKKPIIVKDNDDFLKLSKNFNR